MLMEQFVPVAKEARAPGLFPVGLWLSETTARELETVGAAEELGSWMRDHGLTCLSLNGFPQGDFHEAVVKTRVYEPSWDDPARMAHTWRLAMLLPRISPGERELGVSSVPLGWRLTGGQREQCAIRLRAIAVDLDRYANEHGVVIHIDLEPEPLCALSVCADACEFFGSFLFPGGDRDVLARHLRICLDTCHLAVMRERTDEFVLALDAAGIAIGKVQISAAIAAGGSGRTTGVQGGTRTRLAGFAERRYLHQTTVQTRSGLQCWDDLDDALREAPDPDAHAEWRSHFHVPIDSADLGDGVRSTADELPDALSFLSRRREIRHVEIETYAWTVLPQNLRPRSAGELRVGIIREIVHARSLWHRGEERT